MTKQNIVIIGASGHASVIIDIIEQSGKHTIVGLIDSHKPKGFKLFNYSVLGDESEIKTLIDSGLISGGIVAIGDNATRQRMVETVERISPNFEFITAIHPTVILGKEVLIDKGTVVVAGAIINSSTNIGAHCIINTKASIGHDCNVASFSSVASGATLGGGVCVETGAIICLGATILGNLTIGAHALLGAGAVAARDIPSYAIAIGVPAKTVKQRKADTPYL
jgi:sugar O-acyltransferase (sialic acid O-acetyltransferase NeuD family)